MSMPETLEQVISQFKIAPKPLRLQLLLEYSKKVPPLPDGLQEHNEKMERVDECQTPFFLSTEFLSEDKVVFHFDAPPEAPTTRGFAGILSEGLSGLTPEAILAVPDDFYTTMGLAEVISPLRLRGMSAIMRRLKRQIREHTSEA
ncbi:MAG: SufE family protein [Trueperaceae bacterium]|nr:SufE family protein [Trueperaceae bacterium]